MDARTPGSRRFLPPERCGCGGGWHRAAVRVNALVPRCAVIDLDPVSGVANAPVLKALAARPDPPAPDLPFGVDAFVVDPGVVRPGDPVDLD